MSLLMTRLFVTLLLTPRPARKERGDVPGLGADHRDDRRSGRRDLGASPAAARRDAQEALDSVSNK